MSARVTPVPGQQAPVDQNRGDRNRADRARVDPAWADQAWADQARLLAGHELVLAATLDLALAADQPSAIAIAQATAGRLTAGRGPTRAAAEANQPDAIEPDAIEAQLLQALADSTAVALENLHLREHLAALAASRSAELAALAYSVSHDLRTPIRHLEGFARILLQDVADLPPDSQHGAQRIQEAAIRLREMVNGMLTLSRIGQTEIHWQDVDLGQLAHEVAQALANAPGPASGPDRTGVVEFVAPEHLPVTGDPRLLLTVLQNLLGNAWKFTSPVPHPTVELGVRPAEPGRESGPEFFVRDNGVGFEPASADRLFGAFQRLHSDADFPGIGIGLAAVKRIIDKHGGTVRVTGSPDEGATFFFTLPSGPVL